MLFGQNNMLITALFKCFALETKLEVGVGTRYWVGNFAGLCDGVVILREAQFRSNSCSPIIGTRRTVRIPIGQINFVSQGGCQKWPWLCKEKK
ncbi:hypothetical protein Desde_1359 [Desulfitobacterium dehalogenans ATCC 51507]|uniref:Uncharacterized protein n=1 Tax=Desulfitobacterium dehalogenans (strain ATCC 51507 / DSM 9161 / JW/IU-DC1) TaxID=756499 RepID=I4A748_DESDJ|nr:hypothetical protein [Desulfitobacterium dehalogenans]AFL99782.1 hypothetical protein Desde_1359 [Desulfitobacterium dehalogenans ATCC 51507]